MLLPFYTISFLLPTDASLRLLFILPYILELVSRMILLSEEYPLTFPLCGSAGDSSLSVCLVMCITDCGFLESFLSLWLDVFPQFWKIIWP